MTKSTRFFIAIALQIVIICAIAIFKLSVVSGGTEVLVRIQPVDPRDPLRGDYVTFQYDISSVYGSYNTSYTKGQTVYVPLYKSGKYWVANYVRTDAPTDGSLYLKGVVKADTSRDQLVNITYGAEEYFIPEGTGRTFNFWDKESAALLAVDAYGNSVLKRIYVEGKQWP